MHTPMTEERCSATTYTKWHQKLRCEGRKGHLSVHYSGNEVWEQQPALSWHQIGWLVLAILATLGVLWFVFYL